jgi:hypothetical protein
MPHWGGIIPDSQLRARRHVKIAENRLAPAEERRSPRARVYIDIQQLNVGDKLLSSNPRKP